MFAATLFDYNGVLVDDERLHLAAFQDVLAELSITLDEPTYWRDYLGLDDEGVFRSLLEKDGRTLTEAEVQGLIEAKIPCYLRRAEKTLAGFPGAAELVRSQAQLGPVAIVSGALCHEIELGLRVLGVEQHVDKVIAADHTTRSKPDPEGYLLGIEYLSSRGLASARTETVVFEDSLDGIEAAKAAGLACIGIAHTYPFESLQESNADFNVKTLKDVTVALLAQVYNQTR